MAPPSSFSCARQERKEVYHSIWVPMMCHKATLAPIIPIFGLWRPCMGVKGAKNKNSDVHWFANLFFIFLKDLFYKLCLGCNTSHYLMIFLWKLIKNSYSAIKNPKKLWLQAKFSNFWMQLVPIKNILPFSHNKWDKHLISSKKDLSRVPMFVSQNGTKFVTIMSYGFKSAHYYFWEKKIRKIAAGSL